jgi:hypothetical protein
MGGLIHWIFTKRNITLLLVMQPYVELLQSNACHETGSLK